jgi:hypothetical protein
MLWQANRHFPAIICRDQRKIGEPQNPPFKIIHGLKPSLFFVSVLFITEYTNCRNEAIKEAEQTTTPSDLNGDSRTPDSACGLRKE